MREAGIDISLQKSKKLAVFSQARFDYIITMCDHVKLAVATSFPSGGIRVHRRFDTPSEVREDKAAILADFRTLRDDIDAWLTKIFPDCPGQTGLNSAGRKNDRTGT